MAASQVGAVFPGEGAVEERILDFAKEAMSHGCFDAILIPSRVAAGDSFAHLLIQDGALLKDACPLPPIMPVQGARALSTVTKRGRGGKRIAAVLRPCEAMAATELAKLGQVNLENVVLITVDCPGVMPLGDYFDSPEKGDEVFKAAREKWDSEAMRAVCRICDRFSSTGGEDLHIGTLGIESGSLLLIPGSPKGEEIVEKLGLPLEKDVAGWQEKVNELAKARGEKRAEANNALAGDIGGIDGLLGVLGTCIDCHNCMRVCPICYCRQCYFDSDRAKYPFDDYLARAEARGGLRVPSDTLLFHIGRMLHMSLSCVSCGMCEDACPMDLPVAQIFTLVGDRNQKAFDYVPGRSVDEPLPLATFKEEEFLEVEQSYSGASAEQEDEHA